MTVAKSPIVVNPELIIQFDHSGTDPGASGISESTPSSSTYESKKSSTKIKANIVIHNPKESGMCLAFKFTTNRRNGYVTRPNMGVLPVDCKETIVVTLTEKARGEILTEALCNSNVGLLRCMDKLRIETHRISSSFASLFSKDNMIGVIKSKEEEIKILRAVWNDIAKGSDMEPVMLRIYHNVRSPSLPDCFGKMNSITGTSSIGQILKATSDTSNSRGEFCPNENSRSDEMGASHYTRGREKNSNQGAESKDSSIRSKSNDSLRYFQFRNNQLEDLQNSNHPEHKTKQLLTKAKSKRSKSSEPVLQNLRDNMDPCQRISERSTTSTSLARTSNSRMNNHSYNRGSPLEKEAAVFTNSKKRLSSSDTFIDQTQNLYSSSESRRCNHILSKSVPLNDGVPSLVTSFVAEGERRNGRQNDFGNASYDGKTSLPNNYTAGNNEGRESFVSATSCHSKSSQGTRSSAGIHRCTPLEYRGRQKQVTSNKFRSTSQSSASTFGSDQSFHDANREKNSIRRSTMIRRNSKSSASDKSYESGTKYSVGQISSKILFSQNSNNGQDGKIDGKDYGRNISRDRRRNSQSSTTSARSYSDDSMRSECDCGKSMPMNCERREGKNRLRRAFRSRSRSTSLKRSSDSCRYDLRWNGNASTTFFRSNSTPPVLDSNLELLLGDQTGRAFRNEAPRNPIEPPACRNAKSQPDQKVNNAYLGYHDKHNFKPRTDSFDRRLKYSKSSSDVCSLPSDAAVISQIFNPTQRTSLTCRESNVSEFWLQKETPMPSRLRKTVTPTPSSDDVVGSSKIVFTKSTQHARAEVTCRSNVMDSFKKIFSRSR